jgi:outer membrane protein assembly factor BamB
MPDRIRLILLISATLCLAPSVRADDWPQWLGSQRDGIWREKGLVDTLSPDKPLQLRWRVPVGGGYAGPAVARGKVYVTDFIELSKTESAAKPGGRGRPGMERIICLDEKTGSVLWKHEYPCTYTMDYSAGPRATPTVDGDRVYTLGAEGHLVCLNVDTGKPLWSKHFAEDKSPTPTWGFAAHPLIDGDKLICLTGPADSAKAVTAFDKKTGKVLWQALTAKEIGYCPPMIFESGGVRQLIIWHPESVNSLDPETGKVYWSESFGPVRYGVSIATPRLIKHPKHGDLLFVSSSWDGSKVLKLDSAAPKATVLWERAGKGNTTKGGLHILMAPAMVTSTHIYGVSNGGELRCLDAATGEVLWETYEPTSGFEFSNWSTAFLVPAPTPEKTFLFNEHGDAILAKLSPEGYEEIGRTHLLKPSNQDAGRPVIWCHPAMANGSVYWRNDKEIVSFSLTSDHN